MEHEDLRKEWIEREDLEEERERARRKKGAAPAPASTRLPPEALLACLEYHAEGDFHDLMDLEWHDLEAFARAARDYVPADRRAAFEADLRESLRCGTVRA